MAHISDPLDSGISMHHLLLKKKHTHRGHGISHKNSFFFNGPIDPDYPPCTVCPGRSSGDTRIDVFLLLQVLEDSGLKKNQVDEILGRWGDSGGFTSRPKGPKRTAWRVFFSDEFCAKAQRDEFCAMQC